MASDRVRAMLRALVIAAAGAAGAIATTRGLYANALLAALIAVWVAALNLIDIGQRAGRYRRHPPPSSDGEEERRRLTAYLDLSPAPLGGARRRPATAVNRAARRLLGASDLVADPPTGSSPRSPTPAPAAPPRSTSGRRRRPELRAGHRRSGARGPDDADRRADRHRCRTEGRRSRRVARLVQVLSHEIVNALTPIASLAETAVAMLDDPDPALPQVREAIETVARRAASLHRFGESYRALARLPAPVPHGFAGGFRERSGVAVPDALAGDRVYAGSARGAGLFARRSRPVDGSALGGAAERRRGIARLRPTRRSH